VRPRKGPALVTLALAVALGGCLLAVPFSQDRPSPDSVTGSVAFVDGCESCHGTHARGPYADSLHASMGIRCGQCHRTGAPPNHAEPVPDGKCGGCHQAQLQQTLASKHFAMRIQRPLDGDRGSRIVLRRGGFVDAAPTGERRFVGDAASGELGGRLCAACHYDEHRLGLRGVRRETFCVGCHTGRDEHFPIPSTDPANRCLMCHVRDGETATGQIVNTHRFAKPGGEAAPPPPPTPAVTTPPPTGRESEPAAP
jgi:hypothetical protein